MLRVAVLVDSPLLYDRRALSELETLSRLPISLTVYCSASPGKPTDDSLNGIPVKRVFTDDHWQFKNRRLLKNFANKLTELEYDVLHCHDHFMLSVGAAVKRSRPETFLIYESRELFFSYPINFFNESRFNAFKSRVVRWLHVLRESSTIRLADRVIAVNESIADLLQQRFDLQQRPVVIRNAGPLRIPKPNTLLKQSLSVPENCKLIAYVGSNVYPNVLRLEKLIDQIGNNPDYALVIVANPNIRRAWFESYARERKLNNVLFHDMVPVEQVESFLAGCDIGVLTAWNKKDLSYWHALDNKLFSYVMAGIPVLASAQPEYQKIIEEYGVGVCVNPDEPNAFLNGLRRINERESEFRDNAAKARLVLNWDNEQNALVNLYTGLGVAN
jgi:glycosyltransferase involved in cell wall biosynthesis